MRVLEMDFQVNGNPANNLGWGRIAMVRCASVFITVCLLAV